MQSSHSITDTAAPAASSLLSAPIPLSQIPLVDLDNKKRIAIQAALQNKYFVDNALVRLRQLTEALDSLKFTIDYTKSEREFIVALKNLTENEQIKSVTKNSELENLINSLNDTIILIWSTDDKLRLHASMLAQNFIKGAEALIQKRNHNAPQQEEATRAANSKLEDAIIMVCGTIGTLLGIAAAVVATLMSGGALSVCTPAFVLGGAAAGATVGKIIAKCGLFGQRNVDAEEKANELTPLLGDVNSKLGGLLNLPAQK